MNALFWIVGTIVVGLLVGLTEYSRWQWAARLMAILENRQDPRYRRGLKK